MIMMVSVQYIPAVIKYTKILADSINSIKEAMSDADISVQGKLLMEVSKLLAEAQTALESLKTLMQEAESKQTLEKGQFSSKVKPAMVAL